MATKAGISQFQMQV